MCRRKERRGLVLIDPPFEQPDEFDRLAQALAGAHRKWPTGIYMLWYPIKDARETLALRPPPRPARHSRASCAPSSSSRRAAIAAARAAAG